MKGDGIGEAPLKLEKNRVRRPFKGGLLLDEWQKNRIKEDGYQAEEWVGSMVEAINPERIKNEGLSCIKVLGEEHVLLKALIEEHPIEMLGREHVEKFGVNMGILIKVLDSYSRLLLQVHPTNAFAKAYCDSEYGKTEAWHILGTRHVAGEEPYVLLGFKEGITREKWMKLFEEQDIEGMVDCLHKFQVKPGDTFFVEGGMPHAAGAGVFFLELQEPTDITFRTERKNLVGELLTDQQLHQGVGFEKMFDAFHYDGYKREEVIARCYKAKQKEWLIAPEQCEYFSAREIKVKDFYRDEKQVGFSIVVIVSGCGKIKWEDKELAVEQGDELFLPAQMEEVIWEQTGYDTLCIIQCFPPR